MSLDKKHSEYSTNEDDDAAIVENARMNQICVTLNTLKDQIANPQLESIIEKEIDVEEFTNLIEDAIDKIAESADLDEDILSTETSLISHAEK